MKEYLDKMMTAVDPSAAKMKKNEMAQRKHGRDGSEENSKDGRAYELYQNCLIPMGLPLLRGCRTFTQ